MHDRPRRTAVRSALTGSVLAVVAVALLPAVAAPGATVAAPCGMVTDRPWCDATLDPDTRAGLLLTAMTRDEKISLLAGDELFGVAGGAGTHTGTSNGVERLGIPTLHFSDGPVGTRQGQATQMPSPMSVASSFSTEVAHRDGSVIADEVRKKGNDVVFAPGVNIGRTPLNGRTFEYYGEDPYLAGQMATAFVRGVQGQGVIANVKHFAVNNQEGQGVAVPGSPIGLGLDGSRMVVDARVDERTLREIYLPAFEAAVRKGGAGTVMCSYNRVNGSYSCENSHLLTDILKGDWGFRGLVLTDYGAAKNTVSSLRNGLDLDIWPGFVYNPVLVKGAVLTGQVSAETVDEHVRRILRTMFAFGVFDRPAYVDDASRIDKALHHEAAARIEAQGMVLLKNRGRLLPLRASTLRTLAVIGPEADVIRDGGGSSDVTPFTEVTPLAGLRARLGADRVVYDDGSDRARAARVAAGADAAVVVVGDRMTEGVDKSAPTLNAGQTDGIDRDALVGAVAAAQQRTVAVLQSGGPVLTPWRSEVPAILEMWYPGQNGGTALARVLFGDTEPGGRLPMTFPAAATDLPTAGDQEAYPGVAMTVSYKEGVLVGYRHFDAHGIRPAFAFGHGLGYTSFRFGRPVLRRGNGATVATVSFTVTNTGARTGSAVPQVYLHLPRPTPGVVQPPRQLKAFTKVTLRPGESRRVTLPLDRRSLSWWSVADDGWRVARGCYGVALGASSRVITGRTTLGWGRDCGPGSVRVR
jgi:beta-glucosidase